jgi:uncharacterized protein (DUF2062 family)
MGYTAATQQQQAAAVAVAVAAGDFASFVPGGQQAAQLQGRRTD